MKSFLLTMLLVVGLAPMAISQEGANKVIPAGSKVFIAPMENGFQDYLKAALQAKKVPVVVVEDKASADFEITGHSDTQKAGTAKKVIMFDWRSNEQASIQVTNLKTSQVAFAYSANKPSSAHGKKSTAEACAKHLKEKIESKM
jgi:opacity protein-like surface antigen